MDRGLDHCALSHGNPCQLRRVRIALQRIERLQHPFQQAVGLRHRRLESFYGMRLSGEALIQGSHGLGEQLLHGGDNLRSGGNIRQLDGVLVQARFDLSEPGRIGRFGWSP